jgi:hypothetical protein
MKTRLINLLTMGGTLDWARDRKGVYSLRYVNKIPKFGAAARTAAETAAAAHSGAEGQAIMFAGTAVPEAAEEMGDGTKEKNGTNATNKSDRTDRSDLTDTTDASSAVRGDKPRAEKSNSGWAGAFAKLSSFMAAAFAVVPKTAARFRGRLRTRGADARPRAQAELALEKVTVLRNDLNDADVVVVAAQPKREDSRIAAPPAGGPAGNPWKRVASHWAKRKNPSPFAPAAQAGAGRSGSKQFANASKP